MKEEHKLILNIIEQYLKDNPSIRFGQALFNLNINLFEEGTHDNGLKDIYNDKDEEILKRIKT